MTLSFDTELKVWEGPGGWFFIRLPRDESKDIKELSQGKPKRGFGAVKVDAKIGKSKWQTSVFPDSETKTYILFVKKEIRQKEHIKEGDKFKASITILDL